MPDPLQDGIGERFTAFYGVLCKMLVVYPKISFIFRKFYFWFLVMQSSTFKQDLIGLQEELLNFAYRLTADRDEANDLLQETSLKALDNEDKFTPETNFRGWVYTIMRNIFINQYRKVLRDQTFIDHTDTLYHLNFLQSQSNSGAESAYNLKEMYRIVNGLPKEYKQPFLLHASGFKYREISEKMRLPIGTVKSRIFFTRQRLQQELKDFI